MVLHEILVLKMQTRLVLFLAFVLNQQWEMDYIKSMSGIEKEKGQNIQEYREITIMTMQSKNQLKV